MSDILDFYQEQALSSRSSIPWLAQIQIKALSDFKRCSFPTKRDEDWKYTAIDGFLQSRFDTIIPADIEISKSKFNCPIGRQIAIHNGQVLDADKLSDGLPEGVLVLPLLQAVVMHADKIKPYLGKLLKHEHGFQALNTAALQTGVFIYLPKGVKIDAPFVLAHWQDINHQAIHSRHLIVAEEDSQATIIETYHGDEETRYLTNNITEVYVAKSAKLSHYKVQCESKLAFHIAHLAVLEAANSEFFSHSFGFGGRLVRSDITINLKERQSRCLMNGIYIPTDKQHIDHHTTVHHLVPDCTSVQDYKGILAGKSRAVFNGKVVVAAGALHTKASQQNKNILLSAAAEIDTKPQLEIYADDVVCSHGATVGQLDEEALFYMTTRGINRADACQYLIQGFAAENLSRIPHPELVQWMSDLINQQLR